MRKKGGQVYGVGINDATYPVGIFEKVDGRRKQLWICPIYRAWKDMLKRCYSAKEHVEHPTYAKCSVAPDWLSLSAFRVWMLSQPWEGADLDKDLLSPGNKVYSSDTCIFVPRQLNVFLTDRGAARGEWPTGASRHKASGKFAAQCRNPFIGKNEHLGLFECPDAAHETWLARKHEHACSYADQQTVPRIAAALRTSYARKEVTNERSYST
jgi:hypothetical protein